MENGGFYLQVQNSPVRGDMIGKWVVVISGLNTGSRGTIIQENDTSCAVLFRDGTQTVVDLENLRVLMPYLEGPVGTDPLNRLKLTSPCNNCLHGHNLTDDMEPCIRCTHSANGDEDHFTPI